MSFPTVGELLDSFCTIERKYHGGKFSSTENPFYENFSKRRFNYSASSDLDKVRMVFLKSVLDNPTNKTLRRNGRFIWCKNLSYAGINEAGYRALSFTVDDGKKRFIVSENECLCIPSKTYVNNNSLFRTKDKTFLPFSSVFSYQKALRIMARYEGIDTDKFKTVVQEQKPFRPGTLVIPKVGYFYPQIHLETPQHRQTEHPCGIILGDSFHAKRDIAREFYRVRFGDITYEKIHPIQMEIINAV